MADKIQVSYGLTGKTIYALARSISGTIWNGTSFVSYVSGNYSTYPIALTEQGSSGFYSVSCPAFPAGLYDIECKEQAGGSPSETLDIIAGAGRINWNGTNIIYQTGDSYSVVNHGTYGNAQLVRSSTPANTLNINASHAADVNVTTFDPVTGLNPVLANTAASATSSTIVLNAGASSVDHYYNNMLISIVSGTGIGQARIISDYTGSTKTVTLSRNWTTTPDNTSGFVITNFDTIAAVVGAAMSLVPTERAYIADKLLGRSLAGGFDGGRTVQDALRTSRNKIQFDIPSAGQFTVYAEDDITPAWTGTYLRGPNNLGPLTQTDPA